MIDVNLADKPVNLDEYDPIILYDSKLFLGFTIHNEYDNRRITFNKNYNPCKILHNNGTDITPLYGIIMDLKPRYEKLGNILKQQFKNEIQLSTYLNLIYEFNLKPGDSYRLLKRGIYPVDFKYLDILTDSELAKDKKILQHIIECDENKFDFQKFASLKLFIIN